MLQNAFTVAISADFLWAFAALPKAQQSKVSNFVRNFRQNPAALGINYERINNARDKNLRSARVDQAYRAILLKPEKGNVYVLLWVGHHDQAYAWAEGKECKINPESGSLQILDVASTETATVATGKTTTPCLFAGFDGRDLLRLGVPELYLPRVLNLAADAELEALACELPEEAYDALYKLACGYVLDDVIAERNTSIPAAVDTSDVAAALARPDSRRRFYPVEDEPGLAAMLKAPLAEQIREFVYKRLVSPARNAGRLEIEVRAGDVHRSMGLKDRMPAVCSALGPKFERQCRVKLIDRRGPPSGRGANVFFRFQIGVDGTGDAAPPVSIASRPGVERASTNADRIVATLRRWPDLNDDELSVRSGVLPRQQVNIICRKLEAAGIVNRRRGPSGKIVNRLHSTTPQQSERPAVTADPSARFIDTLVIIPCSGRKSEGGVVESPTAATLLEYLPSELAARLAKARRALAPISGLDEARLMLAWRRYTGSFYAAAGDHLDRLLAAGRLPHLLILSGGYLLMRAIDAIGSYNRALHLSDWPPRLFADAIGAYARRFGLNRARCFAGNSSPYAQLLRSVPWTHYGLTDVVLYAPAATAGAMVKTLRALGEALAALLDGCLTASWRSSDGLAIEVHRLEPPDSAQQAASI
jgi:hypothetical protein